MDLLILRHGRADDFHRDGDSARALVEKGREQARRAARIVKATKWLPEIVLTSPLVRARQTADEFCEVSGVPGALIQGWLACGMSPGLALKELAGFGEFERLAIVGKLWRDQELERAMTRWRMNPHAGDGSFFHFPPH